MQTWSRRSLIEMTIAGLAVGLASLAVPAVARGELRLPPGPKRLTRRLVRELSDGARITVERDWEVRFEPQGRGIAIFGRQIRAEVDAPQRVAAIADIERQRTADGQFPILLGADGMIMAAGSDDGEEPIAQAVAAAERAIASSVMALDEKRRARIYLSQILNAGGAVLDRLPRDLFFPVQDGIHAIRPISLPDGSSGEFEVSYSAVAVPESGLLERADRHVITRLRGTERASSEQWRLRAI